MNDAGYAICGNRKRDYICAQSGIGARSDLQAPTDFTDFRDTVRFRIRSSERDQRADADRLRSIERAILGAIAAADAEEQGLKRRLEDARVRASLLIGTETLEERDQATETLLAGSEREVSAAVKRIRQLTAHREHLQRVLHALTQT